MRSYVLVRILKPAHTVWLFPFISSKWYIDYNWSIEQPRHGYHYFMGYKHLYYYRQLSQFVESFVKNSYVVVVGRYESVSLLAYTTGIVSSSSFCSRHAFSETTRPSFIFGIALCSVDVAPYNWRSETFQRHDVRKNLSRRTYLKSSDVPRNFTLIHS